MMSWRDDAPSSGILCHETLRFVPLGGGSPPPPPQLSSTLAVCFLFFLIEDAIRADVQMCGLVFSTCHHVKFRF